MDVKQGVLCSAGEREEKGRVIVRDMLQRFMS